MLDEEDDSISDVSFEHRPISEGFMDEETIDIHPHSDQGVVAVNADAPVINRIFDHDSYETLGDPAGI